MDAVMDAHAERMFEKVQKGLVDGIMERLSARMAKRRKGPKHKPFEGREGHAA